MLFDDNFSLLKYSPLFFSVRLSLTDNDDIYDILKLHIVPPKGMLMLVTTSNYVTWYFDHVLDNVAGRVYDIQYAMLKTKNKMSLCYSYYHMVVLLKLIRGNELFDSRSLY